MTQSTIEEKSIEFIEHYRHEVIAEGWHTRHEIGVDSRMKWLSFVAVLLFVSVSGASAQWLSPPQMSWLKQGEFDRPHPEVHHLRGMRMLSVPSPETPNWLFPNIDLTNSRYGQFEPSITLHAPYQQDANLVVGLIDDSDYADLGVCSSQDGGYTWSRGLLPSRTNGTFEAATDPSVAYSNGSSILDQLPSIFYLSGYTDEPDHVMNAIGCFQSTDGGKGWSQTTDVFESNDTSSDKYYLAIDDNFHSPYNGRMYAAWVDQGEYSGYTRIVCAHSSDNGVTWSSRRFISGEGHYTSPIPAVEPDSTLLVVYNDYFPNNQILVSRSTDGGATFSAPHVIATYQNVGPMLPDDSMGYQNIGPPDSALAVNSFPSIAIDPLGRTYITWSGRDSKNLPHIWLSISKDDGATWSAPRAIETDSVPNPSAKFFPWVAVDPLSGDVGIAYYVARMDTVAAKQDGGNLMLQAGLYLTHSRDTGVTFTTRRISSATFDPITGQDYRNPEGDTLWFFGDYISLAANGGYWQPVWDDARSGDADIYTANVNPYTPLPVTDLKAHDTIVNGKPGTVLTWIPPTESVFGYPIQPNSYNIIVYNDTTQLTPYGSSGFFDTSASEGHTYVVVVLGSALSLPDTVHGSKAGVGEFAASPNLELRFASEPAIAGREDELFLDCGEACHITITFYDELGREIGAPVSDGVVSIHHEIGFTPDAPGVQFFVMKEISSISSREITGKISVLR